MVFDFHPACSFSTYNQTMLPAQGRPTFLEVDLSRLKQNLENIRARVQPAKVMVVLKANAYGHGVDGVAPFLAPHADYIGVAIVEEGIHLRRLGIRTPILVMGGTLPEQVPLFIPHDLTLSASSTELLDAAQAIAHVGRREAQSPSQDRHGHGTHGSPRVRGGGVRRAIACVPESRDRRHFQPSGQRRRGGFEPRQSSTGRFAQVLGLYQRRGIPAAEAASHCELRGDPAAARGPFGYGSSRSDALRCLPGNRGAADGRDRAGADMAFACGELQDHAVRAGPSVMARRGNQTIRHAFSRSRVGTQMATSGACPILPPNRLRPRCRAARSGVALRCAWNPHLPRSTSKPSDFRTARTRVGFTSMPASARTRSGSNRTGFGGGGNSPATMMSLGSPPQRSRIMRVASSMPGTTKPGRRRARSGTAHR